MSAASCSTCRYWDGKARYWQDPGDVRGECRWRLSLLVAPFWFVQDPPRRVTYDDDGGDCATWSAKEDAPLPAAPKEEPERCSA